MYDKQPILLIFPDEFNKVTQVPKVLPIISGGNFARTDGFVVSFSGAVHAPGDWCVVIIPKHGIFRRAQVDAWKIFLPLPRTMFWSERRRFLIRGRGSSYVVLS